MNKIINSILKLDFFKTQFQVTFQNKSEIKSIFGVVLSLIVFSFSGAIAYQTFNVILEGSKPTVNTSSDESLKSEIFKYGDNEVFFYFQYQNWSMLYDKSYVSFSILQFQRINKTASFRNKLDFENCTDNPNNLNKFEKYGSINNDTLRNNAYYDSICLKNADDLVIGGDFNSDYYSNLYIEMKRCTNSTKSNIVCKSNEAINNSINNFSFSIF
jgi:hypothetical protein